MSEIFERAPGGDKPLLEELRREVLPGVMGRSFRIDLAHGWPRLDQSAADIESDGLGMGRKLQRQLI